MDWFDQVRVRLVPSPAPGVLSVGALAVVALLAAAVYLGPTGRAARLVVTLVHELGHAGVGVLAGRRFTGLVLHGNASGHTVTVGPARGPGRVATTWSGYPAPAVGACLLALAASRGWAAPVLSVVLCGLVLALVRVRSMVALAVVVGVLVGVATLWWWRADSTQSAVLLGAALVLLGGGWVHLAGVVRRGSGQDDPAVLRSLTRVPAGVWILTWGVVNGAATALVGAQLLAMAG